ncbi:D-isomer-specific 2-hydroxyacid dehydrogenase-like protein [Boeremia exigua]|uniref:D-isomer-specific 2-hydroxyacid dehydrogenase-like protein n=1 Tax=Boeremia exigua TaxID=749465 RepID=UPI001E8CEB08|nr:D-isomer-specific 2-hydroxyacid dehydrogenase-like protein [Boeremia exigua]KAH6620533.1 D-isomer-specific 2-hydroxyacid dehydrogenase-like protein [Boeremia exigua]
MFCQYLLPTNFTNSSPLKSVTSTEYSNMASAQPLKLAILDDYHGISLKHFSHLPDSQVEITVFNDTLPSYTHPRTTDAERQSLVERLRPFAVLSTIRERTPFPGELLRQLPNLKVIFATGGKFESWDLATMKELGITVCTAPGKGRTDGKGSGQSPRSLPVKQGGGHPTTQHVWALILALARNVAADDAVVKGKRGPKAWQTGLAIGLQGKTLGLVGLGRIGSHVARVGVLAFGMKIVCWSANLTQEKADQLADEAGLPVTGGGMIPDDEKTFKVVSKQEVFASADVVSLHYVLSERSKGIVSSQELEWMKPSGLLVNTSRGPLVDESALLDTLRHGRIGGAAIDVFDIEPLPADSPWRSEDWDMQGKSRVVLTPHMGYVEEGTLTIWYEETAENLERLLEGKELLNVI